MLLAAFSHSRAAEPDTISPVVSYQYLDSLSDPQAQTTISSPVVSYQYFDWPGDENLTFTNSANVSYYFDGPPRILTQPTDSEPRKEGTSASFAVVADGTAPLTYQWALNGGAISGATNASLTVANLRQVDAGFYSVMVSNPSGQARSGNAALQVYSGVLTLPPPVGTSTPAIDGLPEVFAQKPVSRGALLLFNPSTSKFEPLATSLLPGRMAIVMTHGWFSSANGSAAETAWPALMADAFATSRAPDGKLYSEKAFLFAWDWSENAATKNPGGAAGYTPAEGAALGKALFDGLEADYGQAIHFIGHSSGRSRTVRPRIICTALSALKGIWRRALTHGRTRT